MDRHTRPQGEEILKQVEGQVKTLLADGAKEGTEKLVALRKDLDDCKKALDSINENIRQFKAGTLPGLAEQLKKEPFDFGRFAAGLKNIRVANLPFKSAFDVADAGHEREVIEQYAKLRDMGVDVGPSGGYLVPPEVSQEVISLATARMPLLKMGTTIITGLTGDLAVNRVSARPTGYWVGETGKPTSSDATFAQKWLRPKKVGAFSKVSNRLLQQSRGVADRVIREELATGMALTMHKGLCVGKGSEFEPLGIFTAGGTTSSNVTTGSNGHRQTIDDMAQMILDLENADELIDGGKFGFLCNPSVRSGLKRERAEMYSGQATTKGMTLNVLNPLMTNEMLNELLYPIECSTHVAKYTVGTSTTCSKVLFGNMQFFYVGLWRDLIIKASDVAGDGSTGSAFTEDQLYIVAFQECDCQVVRPTAFTIAAGAETNKANW